jgi:hypothetical protein
MSARTRNAKTSSISSALDNNSAAPNVHFVIANGFTGNNGEENSERKGLLSTGRRVSSRQPNVTITLIREEAMTAVYTATPAGPRSDLPILAYRRLIHEQIHAWAAQQGQRHANL